jgi:hypothetical protein
MTNPANPTESGQDASVPRAAEPMAEPAPRATAFSGSGVTWVHSYVSSDKSTTFCVYDGPSPEAIRHTAELNGLPVDRITEVRVLDPYFYR